MKKCAETFALDIAIELAKLNIQSSDGWSKSDDVIHFIEKVYNYFLSGEVKPDTTK